MQSDRIEAFDIHPPVDELIKCDRCALPATRLLVQPCIVKNEMRLLLCEQCLEKQVRQMMWRRDTGTEGMD